MDKVERHSYIMAGRRRIFPSVLQLKLNINNKSENFFLNCDIHNNFRIMDENNNAKKVRFINEIQKEKDFRMRTQWLIKRNGQFTFAVKISIETVVGKKSVYCLLQKKAEEIEKNNEIVLNSNQSLKVIVDHQ